MGDGHRYREGIALAGALAINNDLAALHLSLRPPQLDEAALAIDALGALIERLEGRLGDEEATLRDGLAQLRLAFVSVKSAATAAQASGDDES